ncbi:MAG: MarR family winged helix-turn-helix transcriptional regulator [Hyphomicrobiaceae bacterium]
MSKKSNSTEQCEELFHILHRAEQRAKTLFAEEARGLDLTVRQLVILDVVARNNGMMQTDIVSLTGIDRSTVTELVARMVNRGLLARQRNRRDARAYLVSVTGDGQGKLVAAEKASKKAAVRFLEAVPVEYRSCFLGGLTSAANVESG